MFSHVFFFLSPGGQVCCYTAKRSILFSAAAWAKSYAVNVPCHEVLDLGERFPGPPGTIFGLGIMAEDLIDKSKPDEPFRVCLHIDNARAAQEPAPPHSALVSR